MNAFLYENLDSEGIDFDLPSSVLNKSVVSGYWSASAVVGDSYSAWVLNYSGGVGNGSIGIDDGWGVRPVITVKI